VAILQLFSCLSSQRTVAVKSHAPASKRIDAESGVFNSILRRGHYPMSNGNKNAERNDFLKDYLVCLRIIYCLSETVHKKLNVLLIVLTGGGDGVHYQDNNNTTTNHL